MKTKRNPPALNVPIYLNDDEGNLALYTVRIMRFVSASRQADVIKDTRIVSFNGDIFAVREDELDTWPHSVRIYSTYLYSGPNFHKIYSDNLGEYRWLKVTAGYYNYSKLYRAFFLLGLITSAQERSALAEITRLASIALEKEGELDAEKTLLKAIHSPGMTLPKAKKLIEREIHDAENSVKPKKTIVSEEW